MPIHFLRLCLLSTAVLGAANAGAWAQSAPLAAHRAVYDISLDRTTAGSGVSELVGRMVYELTGNDCKGYAQRIRFVTRTESPKGKQTLMDLRSTYRESAGANRFQFESRQYQNERLIEETAGRASRNGDASEVDVRLRKPLKKRMTLDKDILFPIEHTQRVLAAARAGKRIYASTLYDGSEKGLKVYDTTAVIGDKKEAGHNATLPKVADAKTLDSVISWPVSLSYFGKSKGARDGIPEYELAFLFFENGVSRRLLIDYGSFAIRARLVGLKMLDSGKCKPGR